MIMRQLQYICYKSFSLVPMFTMEGSRSTQRKQIVMCLISQYTKSACYKHIFACQDKIILLYKNLVILGILLSKHVFSQNCSIHRYGLFLYFIALNVILII